MTKKKLILPLILATSMTLLVGCGEKKVEKTDFMFDGSYVSELPSSYEDLTDLGYKIESSTSLKSGETVLEVAENKKKETGLEVMFYNKTETYKNSLDCDIATLSIVSDNVTLYDSFAVGKTLEEIKEKQPETVASDDVTTSWEMEDCMVECVFDEEQTCVGMTVYLPVNEDGANAE